MKAIMFVSIPVEVAFAFLVHTCAQDRTEQLPAGARLDAIYFDGLHHRFVRA
jgi:hypothetical protein